MFNLQRKLGEGTSQSLGKWQIEKKVEFSKVKLFDVINFVELQLMKLLHYQFQVCNFIYFDTIQTTSNDYFLFL